MSAPRLRAPRGARRGNYLFSDWQVIDAPRGRPAFGGASHHNVGIDSFLSYWIREFNMEMSSKIPFCVPVAAGIVSVFMGNPRFFFILFPI